MTASAYDRGDVIWQDANVVSNYQVSSKTIPFVDVHFEIMHRLIEAAGIQARNVLDLGAGNGIVEIPLGNTPQHLAQRIGLRDHVMIGEFLDLQGAARFSRHDGFLAR